ARTRIVEIVFQRVDTSFEVTPPNRHSKLLVRGPLPEMSVRGISNRPSFLTLTTISTDKSGNGGCIRPTPPLVRRVPANRVYWRDCSATPKPSHRRVPLHFRRTAPVPAYAGPARCDRPSPAVFAAGGGHRKPAIGGFEQGRAAQPTGAAACYPAQR